MSCKYKDQCPSYSGWCEGPKQDFSRCVEFLVTAPVKSKKHKEEYIMTKEEQVIETIRKGPGMSPNEYQRLALRTASDESMKDPLLNGLLGLGGETGECQDLYKKHRFQGHELDKAKMAKELGDVSWYLALTAYAIGYNLEDIFKMNIEKLRARYPDGFDADHSLHRRPGDI